MDSNKKNQDTSNLRNVQYENSANQNRDGTLPTEPPPSYSEAMQNPPFQDVSYTTPRPTAPTLEGDNVTPYPTGAYAPGQFPQPGDQPYPNAQNDRRFENWDDRATRLLIQQRLEMNEQFARAKSAWEQEMLWNMILNDLLGYGYHFSIIDLIQFWEFQFQIYKSIINGVSNASWEFFGPMHRVFGSSSSSSDFSDTAYISSPTIFPIVHPTPVIPITPPPVEPNRALETINTTTADPNASSAIPTISNLPTTTSPTNADIPVSVTPVIPDTSALPTATTLPAEISSSLGNAVATPSLPDTTAASLPVLDSVATNATVNESVPLLTPSNGGSNLVGDSVVGSSSNFVESSVSNTLADSAIQTSAVSEVAAGPSIADAISTSQPTSNLFNGPNSNDLELGTITTQPDQSFSIPKFINDNDVVTTQPTLSSGMLETNTGDTSGGNDDGCCGEDGCCEDDCCGGGGCCDDNDGGGCCDGGGGGNDLCCDDGCGDCDDGCGDCGDCDCD